MQWPCIDLVALTATRAATSSPSTSWSILTSAGSPGLLAPPWALTWSTSSGRSPASASAARTARACGRRARVRVGDVVGVGARAVAGHLAEDPRAARQRVLQALQHHHGAGLAHQEAVAVLVEGPRRAGGVVVAVRQHAHRVEAGQEVGGDQGLAAPGEHRAGVPAADDVRGDADRVGPRGARRADGGHGPAQAQLDRHLAGAHVGHAEGDGERRDPVGPALQHHPVLLLARDRARAPVGDDRPDARRRRGRWASPSRPPPGGRRPRPAARSGPCAARPCGP